MDDYVPMTGPMPGKLYEPTNGRADCGFLDAWCSRCERDKELNGAKDSEDCGDGDWCPIVAASFRNEAIEWRELDDGSTRCMAFAPLGYGIPPPRCEKTADLFDGVEAAGA